MTYPSVAWAPKAWEVPLLKARRPLTRTWTRVPLVGTAMSPVVAGAENLVRPGHGSFDHHDEILPWSTFQAHGIAYDHCTMMPRCATSTGPPRRDQRTGDATATAHQRPRQRHRNPRPAPPSHGPPTADTQPESPVHPHRPGLPHRPAAPTPPHRAAQHPAAGTPRDRAAPTP